MSAPAPKDSGDRLVLAADLAIKAAEVRWGGQANDSLGRTQLLMAAMFDSLTEEQQEQVCATLARWSTP